jgi:DNA-binding Lrp family transcriptional regulator
MRKNDKLIISYLRQDSRIQLTKMSKKTKIPVSTLFERLKNYKKGIIKKNTAIVDFSKLGYNTRAKILLKCKRENIEQLRIFLERNKHTNELFKVNNGFDFMVEFICTSMHELEGHLEKLYKEFKIEKELVFYIIEEIKRENFLSDPKKS